MTEQEKLEENVLGQLDVHRANPMNDVLFKFIFGKIERKNITIDFLNAVLEPSLGHKIKNIMFLPTEQIPQNEEEKLSRLDVACELDTGEYVDVEVQVVNYQNMKRRTLYYWSQVYLMRLPAGADYNDLRPTITINILAFELLPQDDPHAMYGLYNPETHERLNEDLELHFIELPKFVKRIRKPIREMTKMERWMAYFANRLNQQEKEELAMSEAAINHAYDATNIFLQNQAERLRYINREMALMDYRSGIMGAEERGEKRGEKRGEERGKVKAWTASVHNLMNSMHWTAEQAIEAAAVPQELREIVRKQL
ncbi:MAG: Rpn family recombination-promoting nuclease/putative transposase [Selenomonas sp.]|uniref:Rpn family recombination-promoting nuclease/putative transposase n=1 Tax=Selenomonas sp. TaxID=2053611 RepID=UPI0025D752E1|nr:Rpn family recombination-promoting nuclease/putative transposase [Selenomonas sp.]MCI6085208.1 Rpn family recombination-promoting nuclease/putative transposase [Selenomonas sp.]MDY4416506.1 Rpn family recombination-promoting nuclease/putative transposase [Selenomonas sp.]